MRLEPAAFGGGSRANEAALERVYKRGLSAGFTYGAVGDKVQNLAGRALTIEMHSTVIAFRGERVLPIYEPKHKDNSTDRDDAGGGHRDKRVRHDQTQQANANPDPNPD